LNPDQYPTISKEEIKDFYKKRKNFTDGICLTGGEPTLYEDVIDFIKEFRDMGSKIKLDTNGTSPQKVQTALDKKLVDYIAMDVKSPLVYDSYKKASGIKNESLLDRIKETIKVIMNSSIEYEFRTTVVPTLHKKEDILEIARSIKGAKKYALQNFQNEGTLDEKLIEVQPYKIEELENFAKEAEPYVEKIAVRGRG
jgi:pyruvate formate lyase activating enzyme